MRTAHCCLLLAALLWASPALAGDASLRWRSVDTPHFQLHYPQGLEAVAWRAARLCEEAWELLTPVMQHRPAGRIQVVLQDFGDSANGSATVVPYAKIALLAAPPSLDGNLGDYDDWLRLLVFHEFTHILQLDPISGVPSAINAVLGRVMAPNHNMPSFVLEGGAVWAESATSGRGRIRSASFRGSLRAQALADRLYDIDAVVHAPERHPSANVWYMYGGHFMHWIAERRGPGTFGRAHAALGDEMIPFNVNDAFREASGQPLTHLYAAWIADLRAKSRAELAALEREGLTQYMPITQIGGAPRNPRFLPSGDLLSLEGGHKEGGLYSRGPRSVPTEDPTLHLDTEGLGRFDVCPGGAIVFDRSERVGGAYTFHDLHLFDPHSRKTRRLTQSARVREPGCSPDGRWAAAVQLLEGRTRLVRVDLADGRITTLHDPGGLDQVGHPAVDAAGRVVFSLVSAHLGRDLVRLDPDGRLSRLTRDAAVELHPSFDASHQWLVYASDRSGTFDIYAQRWPEGRPQRVTRVLTGATDPVLRDGRLVFAAINSEGQDLAWIPFEPEALLPMPVSAEEVGGPLPLRPAVEDAPLHNRAYAPLETLWPVAWSPAFSVSNAQESAASLGVDVEAGDAAGQHLLIGSFGTAPEDEALNLSVSYGLRVFVPAFSVSLAHRTGTSDGAFHGNLRQPFRERVTAGSLATALPFTAAGHRATVSLRYGLSRSTPAENPDPVHDPLDEATFIPGPSTGASASLGMRYGNSKSWQYSISEEAGRSVGLSFRMRHPKLGGEFETAEIFWDYSEYLGLWFHHVLAFRATGAFGRGDSRRLFYSLGAPQERNLLVDTLDATFFGSTQLRGYPGGTVGGDRYVLLTAEYRLPVARVFRGFSMVPVFLRRLTLSLFTDWGQAAEEPLGPWPEDFRKSAGAELATEYTLGWRLLATARLGYAHGIDDDGEGQLYFFLGSAF